MRPEGPLAGVRGVDADVEELYAASYDRLVAVVGVVCGSGTEAEEAVQEAFIRLLGWWDTVSRYDDPEAWLRKVALGFASNRRRKVRGGVRALVRRGPVADIPGPAGDGLDLARALRQLPRAQREALVLHHLLDLDVAQVARELDVPVSTVKSRLQRGRAALAPMLEGDDRV